MRCRRRIHDRRRASRGASHGCLLITVIANGLDIMGVSSHWQKIVKGVIIVVAVLIDVKGKTKKN
ncbi:MAG: hypothetical protein ACLRVN_03735 [Butyricicoccus sp.]